MIKLLILVAGVISKHPTDLKIASLESSLQELVLARSLFNANQKPKELNPLPLSIASEEWLLNKVIPRSKIQWNDVVNAQFLTLKPIGPYRDVANSLNIALAVAYTNGMLEILQTNGELLCGYNLTYPAKLLATTTGYDDIKIAAISPDLKLEIYELHMEKLRKNETDPGKVIFRIAKESYDDIVTPYPTSIIYYVKTGKKYWVIGDAYSELSVHLFNSTLYKHINLNLGPITSLERFGQTLVFGTNTSIGVVNPTTLELQQVCLDVGNVKDLCIDTMSSSAYVYALTSDSLVALDTKFQHGTENYCKGIL